MRSCRPDCRRRMVAELIGLAEDDVGCDAACGGDSVEEHDAVVAAIRDKEAFPVGVGKARKGESLAQRSG